MVDIFAQSLGLVREGDTLSLSPGLELNRYNLVDTANGARHKVSRSAYHALDLLRYPISLELWIQSGSVKKLRKKQAVKLLLLADQLACLSVERSLMNGVKIRVRRLLLSLRGVPLMHNSERHLSTILSLIKLVWRASRVLLVAIAITGVMMYGVNVPVRSYLISQAVFIFVLLTTALVHELTHWLMLGQLRSRAVFVRRGMRIGLLHTTQTKRSEFHSAVLGPLVGMVLGFAMSLGIYTLSNDITIAAPGVMAASFHAVSWLPMYGDGRVLFFIGSRSNA